MPTFDELKQIDARIDTLKQELAVLYANIDKLSADLEFHKTCEIEHE